MAELGVQLWLGPDAGVMRSPQEARFAEKWSEDPVVCGAMTSALAGGAWPYGTAVLHAQSLPETVSVSQSALRDVYGLPFEIAANSCRAAKLPGLHHLRPAAHGEQSAPACMAARLRLRRDALGR